MTKEQQYIYEQNDRVFCRVAGKIGLGMVFFWLIFNGLGFVVAMVQAICLELAPGETWAFVVGETLSIIAYLFGFLFSALLLRSMLKKSKDYHPMGGAWHLPRVTPLLIVGAIAINFAASYFNSTLVSLFLPDQTSDLSSLLNRPNEWYEILLLFISTAVVPAIVEEILFRGVILNALLPFGGTVAVLGSAFLFSLMHGNIFQLFYTALMGIILGYVYIRTRSIWCGVLIHFFNNTVSVVQEILFDLPDVDTALRWNAVMELILFLAGGFSVFALLMLYDKRRRIEDHGSFGVIFEPAMDYQRYPTTKGKTVKNFFSPAMIVFVILSSLDMLIAIFNMMVGGRI